MSQFHTDEYVEFLNRVTPDNVDAFVREQAKCRFSRRNFGDLARLQADVDADVPHAIYHYQSTWEMTVPSLMASSNTAQYLQVAQWVRVVQVVIDT